jgi:valyl-tRNA synthetase
VASEHQAKELPTVYDPASVEKQIYEYWETNGFFKAGLDKSKPPFSIVIPPPNVTGVLHLGHAWNNTNQDITIRYKRMAGYDALWLPGTDHAGIATQTRVEKMLQQKEGKSRHDIGREAFVEHVWDWKREYGNIITNQARAFGNSVDWSRERFTMDEGLSQAVREVFVRLYDKGLIYRGNRIINWCPRCSTALSDIEVDHVDVEASLYHVQYPFTDGIGGMVIATTRPETMFADVAIAVHPEDEKYQPYIGKTVKLPLTDREIPVIADDYVDREFGTGCLKITPAHDPNDFEVGTRHDLPRLQCIDADGRLTEIAGTYAGLTREEARTKVVADLEAGGYLVKVEPLLHAVGHCSRCSTVVEPFLSDQWFVKMDALAQPALEAVRAGKLHFVPERFDKIFIHWLENVRDWCISRQLWWGHRIPAWYCDDCGEITVSRTDVTSCSHCQGTNIRQEEDVLDTWFSSALWPFSTMGWPNEEASDLKRYYPTSALMTAYDILFFWVARMVFMGLEFTGQMPFQDIVIHGLIRDSEGRKMSKSLGNGIDPLEVVAKYGADAMRFTLATSASPGNDQRFYWEKIEASRNFINKIWNASRYVMMNLPEDNMFVPLESAKLDVADAWILHRLNETILRTSGHLNRYDFGEAGRAIYDFAWDDFCDWYIELSKLSLYGEDVSRKQVAQSVLLHVLDQLLRLLHPFIPFVTEEIWQSLPVDGEALIVADWPKAIEQFYNPQEVEKMVVVMDAIRAVRNMRAEMNVAPSKNISMVIKVQNDETERLFESVRNYVSRFCHAEDLKIGLAEVAPKNSVSAVVTGAELYVPLADLVDLAQERDRLEKEKARLQSEVDRVEKKLSNPQFVEKAPEKVVELEREKAADYKEKLTRVEERIASLVEQG